MIKTDLLTIALPVYERKDYFEKALESALNQTVGCNIIVVDNCSSHDFFRKVCKKKNISYHRNEKNIGLFPNWNKCFELAESEYVMILGDDDILASTYVEAFLEAKDKYPDIDIFFSDFILSNLDTGEEYSHKHTLPFGYMDSGAKILEFGIKYKLGFPLITSSVKKEKFTGYYAGFHASNDWLWIYSNAADLVFFGDPQKLCKYAVHTLQDSAKNKARCMLSCAYIYDKILEDKVSGNALKKKIRENAFWALVVVKAGANSRLLKELKTGDNIYSNYLINKIKTNWKIKTLFSLPQVVVNFTYRVIRKLGFGY